MINKSTSLVVGSWVMFFAPVSKEFMGTSCLNDWGHDIHEGFGTFNVSSLSNFEKIIEILVVGLIGYPVINDFSLFIGESSWVNSQELLVFSVTEFFIILISVSSAL